MGSRDGLDGCGKSRPHRGLIPDRPARRESLRCPGPPARSSTSEKTEKYRFDNCTQTILGTRVYEFCDNYDTQWGERFAEAEGEVDADERVPLLGTVKC